MPELLLDDLLPVQLRVRPGRRVETLLPLHPELRDLHNPDRLQPVQACLLRQRGVLRRLLRQLSAVQKWLCL
jgi:hypothetical protein